MGNLSSAARGVMAGIRNRHYDPNQPRDRTGKWTDGGGHEPPAPQGITDLYNRMKNEGLTRSQMIARAQAEGHPDAEKHITNLMRQTAREGRRALKKAGIERIIKKRKGKGVVEEIQKKVGGDGIIDQLRKLNKESRLGSQEAQTRALLFLQAHEKTAATAIKMEHGMPGPEKMFVVNMDGIPLHYAMDSQSRMTAAALMAKTAVDPLPPELTRHTRNVFISTLRNSADPKWEVRYKTPGFISAATGGDGNVVFYNTGGGSMSSSWNVLAHEMGHNLAKGVYGNTDPGPSSGIGALYDRWKSKASGYENVPTHYARHNRSEAFAEAIARYFGGKAGGYDPLTPKYQRAVEGVLAQSRAGMQGRQSLDWNEWNPPRPTLRRPRKGTRGTISIVYENGKPRIRRTG